MNELLVHVTVSEWSFSAAVQELDLAWLRRTILLVVPMRHITAYLCIWKHVLRELSAPQDDWLADETTQLALSDLATQELQDVSESSGSRRE